jgi:hypothetical protein
MAGSRRRVGAIAAALGPRLRGDDEGWDAGPMNTVVPASRRLRDRLEAPSPALYLEPLYDCLFTPCGRYGIISGDQMFLEAGPAEKSMFTKDQLETHLRERWAARGCNLADGERMGIAISELVAESIERNSQLKAPYVDLWIAILDEFISWKFSLLTIFFSDRREQYELTDFDRSITMLLFKIIGDATAIRHLILLGFDVSACTLLRSTAEYMELFVALLNEPQLAREFVRTQTPEQGRTFWKAHLASGGIRKKIYAAWREFFRDNADREAAQWFANWGDSSNSVLSGVLHPSYMGGVFTAKAYALASGEINMWSSWPGLTRPSTRSQPMPGPQGVDARHKAGHHEDTKSGGTGTMGISLLLRYHSRQNILRKGGLAYGGISQRGQ